MLMAGAFMPALAKVGALKLPLLLRAAGITAGAAPSLMRGDIGGAVVGGGLGALGTLGLSSAASMATKPALKGIFAAGTKAGLTPGNIATLQGVAQAGIPLGIGALGGGSAAGLLGRPAKNS